MAQTAIVIRRANAPDDVERLLRGLPEWFGIETALRQYVEDARRLPSYVAADPDTGAIVGTLLVKRHFPSSAEVHLMAVARERHRQGIGRLLLDAAEADLRSEGVAFLQVKTLGSSRADPNYTETRAFYLASGFTPLEEFLDLWDEGNPCLLMVKRLLPG